jgi:hypothetical protein
MAVMREYPGVTLFSLEEANRILPKIRGILASLRSAKKDIVASQARVDIEEMTGNKAAIEAHLRGMEQRVADFHSGMSELTSLGCELKDFDKGLIDFYSLRDNQVVYLCWMEGEEDISHWHGLEEGFAGRKEL